MIEDVKKKSCRSFYLWRTVSVPWQLLHASHISGDSWKIKPPKPNMSWAPGELGGPWATVCRRQSVWWCWHFTSHVYAALICCAISWSYWCVIHLEAAVRWSFHRAQCLLNCSWGAEDKLQGASNHSWFHPHPDTLTPSESNDCGRVLHCCVLPQHGFSFISMHKGVITWANIN